MESVWATRQQRAKVLVHLVFKFLPQNIYYFAAISNMYVSF